jgi:4-alpha-glucanotransferase
MRRALVGTLRAAGMLRGRGLPDAGAIAAAALEYLASSEARAVMVTLEDLWEERRAHNVPGTHDAHPNWRHRSRHTLEEMTQMPGVTGLLRRVDHLRRDGVGGTQRQSGHGSARSGGG